MPHLDVGFCGFQDRSQFWIVHGFGDEILRALLHGFDSKVDAGVRRDQNDRPIRIAGLKAPQKIEAGELRHHDVGDNDFRIIRLHEVFRLGSIGGEANLISPLLQNHFEDFADRWFVIDDQNLRLTHA